MDSENRKLRVSVRKREVLAGTGLGAAGASNREGLPQGQGAIPHGSPAPRWREPVPPGKASPLVSTSLPISPSSSNSLQGPGPAAKSMTLQSLFKFK